ncbi:hypothetical protein PR048_019198 [Dryococelus australis]|uniref:DUF4371 domain-containing protein n=1 Tax=Dryococelus australis TaxID=614101 RepID=A0ABQ9H2X3_9NEOP|nr:hypothetical protein PR048_019198 [Dryococelus australis]
MFSVICDGTRDVSGLEQESVCVCWVNENFEPQESFLGFYQASSTTGVAISCHIQDILLRLKLPLADRAGNMSGSQKGAQALTSEIQPLAPSVYCGAHYLNLVMMDCCEASKTGHEVGKLISKSIKAKSAFTHIAEQSLDLDPPIKNIGVKIKPLCPTRWIHTKSQIDEIANMICC